MPLTQLHSFDLTCYSEKERIRPRRRGIAVSRRCSVLEVSWQLRWAKAVPVRVGEPRNASADGLYVFRALRPLHYFRSSRVVVYVVQSVVEVFRTRGQEHLLPALVEIAFCHNISRLSS